MPRQVKYLPWTYTIKNIYFIEFDTTTVLLFNLSEIVFFTAEFS
jgi:hypothetical protein